MIANCAEQRVCVPVVVEKGSASSVMVKEVRRLSASLVFARVVQDKEYVQNVQARVFSSVPDVKGTVYRYLKEKENAVSAVVQEKWH